MIKSSERVRKCTRIHYKSLSVHGRSTRSTSSVTSPYDNCLTTKCDYWTEVGRYVSVTNGDSMRADTKRTYWHWNNFSRAPSVPQRAFYCICMGGHACQSLKSAARLPTLSSLATTSTDDYNVVVDDYYDLLFQLSSVTGVHFARVSLDCLMHYQTYVIGIDAIWALGLQRKRVVWFSWLDKNVLTCVCSK